MIRLKELREAASKTQAQIAAELNISQQTYARWEKGQTSPSHQALRNISQVFETTVDRILGPIHSGPPSKRVGISLEKTEPLWGHLGLRLPSAPHTRWYPVGQKQASKLRESLSSGYNLLGWLVTQTLDNRILAFRPDQIQRMRLLDEAGGEPEDDFELASPFGYDLMSLETYKAMADWENWKTEGDDTFSPNRSKVLKKQVLATIDRLGFSDRITELRRALRFTTLYFTDGHVASYESDRSALSDLLMYIEAGAELNNIELPDRDGDLEEFCHWSMVRLIEFPLIELEAAWEDADA